MNYYYFMASLPPVSLTGVPPVGLEVFLADARRLLDAKLVATLEAALERGFEGVRGAAGEPLRAAEVLLRNAIARTRAARRDEDATPFLKPVCGGWFSVEVESVVAEAFGKPNPLERELVFERYRWELLEEWSRTTPFGERAVLAYAMKLKMAHRWAQLNDEAGRARLNETVAQVRAAPAETIEVNG